MNGIVNLTPHPLNVVLADGKRVVVPSQGLIRVAETTEVVGAHRIEEGDVRLVRKRFGDLDQASQELLLKHAKQGVIIVVSMAAAKVISRMVKQGKLDLKGARVVFPAELLRDENGKVIGCKAFAVEV